MFVRVIFQNYMFRKEKIRLEPDFGCSTVVLFCVEVNLKLHQRRIWNTIDFGIRDYLGQI